MKILTLFKLIYIYMTTWECPNLDKRLYEGIMTLKNSKEAKRPKR